MQKCGRLCHSFLIIAKTFQILFISGNSCLMRWSLNRGTVCPTNSIDTVIEYRRSKEADSESNEWLKIQLFNNDFEAEEYYHDYYEVKLESILNSPDHTARTHNLGKLPKFDAIKLTIGGNDGAAFDHFQLKEGDSLVFDLVATKRLQWKPGDCQITNSVWLDGDQDEDDDECYRKTAFTQETFEINRSTANYNFDNCKL